MIRDGRATSLEVITPAVTSTTSLRPSPWSMGSRSSSASPAGTATGQPEALPGRQGPRLQRPLQGTTAQAQDPARHLPQGITETSRARGSAASGTTVLPVSLRVEAFGDDVLDSASSQVAAALSERVGLMGSEGRWELTFRARAERLATATSPHRGPLQPLHGNAVLLPPEQSHLRRSNRLPAAVTRTCCSSGLTLIGVGCLVRQQAVGTGARRLHGTTGTSHTVRFTVPSPGVHRTACRSLSEYRSMMCSTANVGWEESAWSRVSQRGSSPSSFTVNSP